MSTTDAKPRKMHLQSSSLVHLPGMMRFWKTMFQGRLVSDRLHAVDMLATTYSKISHDMAHALLDGTIPHEWDGDAMVFTMPTGPLPYWLTDILEGVRRLESACDPERQDPQRVAQELAHALHDASTQLLEADPNAHKDVESQFGGPGPQNDHDELVEWVRENPDQAEDFLQALRDAVPS